jgi:hypothetical protein
MRISSFVISMLVLMVAACGDDGGGTPEEQTCANYCTTITAACTGANSQYGSAAECMATCALFPPGAAADMAGHTLGCRIYHAGASETGADVHCRHAGPGGDTACGTNCTGFCALVLGACTGANAQYGGDMNACMTACGGFATTPAYDSSKTSGNSFACRLYHATAASANPALHCSHTGATSATCN